MKNRLFSIAALTVSMFMFSSTSSCQNGPTPSQIFHYAVTAVSANGESAYSNDVVTNIPNDGKTHTVTLSFVPSSSTGVTKNCWYRSAANGSSGVYVLPGTCSSSPVTTFTDNTVSASVPPSPPTALGFILAKLRKPFASDSTVAVVTYNSDGKVKATVN